MKAALSAVQRSCRLAKRIQMEFALGDELSKADASPVTVADFSVQALITHLLQRALPDEEWRLLAEEDADALRGEKGTATRRAVFDAVNQELRMGGEEALADEEALLELLAAGGDEGGAGTFWVLDPIDGTKGYIRGDQYAVALARFVDGELTMGLLGCPALPPALVATVDGEEPPALSEEEEAARGSVMLAAKGEGAWTVAMDGDVDGMTRLSVSDAVGEEAVYTTSFVSSHSRHTIADDLSAAMHLSPARIRIDSQAKYAIVARGDAALYLRLPKGGYEQSTWDHAAGVLIVEEAGGRVTDMCGAALDWSAGASLSRNVGVVASNGAIHDAALAAIKELNATASL
eukprot:PLAT7513.1.p1 GENE.PLAT7513.1~~PLAT7513.1.p1  ORF type:complete len:362 (-),score=151.36 PLAT7513.1:20-1060(-)